MVADDKEQVAALSLSLAVSLKTAFRVPCFIRTSQWGMIDGPQGAQMAGDFWLLTEDEADALGSAWAAVIALYVPADMIAGSSVALAAVMVTAGTLIPRIMTDTAYATMHKAAAQAPPSHAPDASLDDALAREAA